MAHSFPSLSRLLRQPPASRTAEGLNQSAVETAKDCPAKDAEAIESAQPEAVAINQRMLFQENTFHAQNLPLRGQDLQILKELFNQEGIEAIESDILENLEWRCPEPCWEDDPFEFLREYL